MIQILQSFSKVILCKKTETETIIIFKNNHFQKDNISIIWMFRILHYLSKPLNITS